MEKQPPNDKLKSIHKLLSSQYSDIPEYEEFEGQLMSDPEKQKKIHSLLTDNYGDIPEFDEFVTQAGLKKKGQSHPPLLSAEDQVPPQQPIPQDSELGVEDAGTGSQDRLFNQALQTSLPKAQELTGLDDAALQRYSVLADAIYQVEQDRDGNLDKALKSVIDPGTVDDTVAALKKAIPYKDKSKQERSYGIINMKPSAIPAALQGIDPKELNNPETASLALILKLAELDELASDIEDPALRNDAIITAYHQGPDYIKRLYENRVKDGGNQFAPEYKTDSYAESVLGKVPSVVDIGQDVKAREKSTAPRNAKGAWDALSTNASNAYHGMMGSLHQFGAATDDLFAEAAESMGADDFAAKRRAIQLQDLKAAEEHGKKVEPMKGVVDSWKEFSDDKDGGSAAQFGYSLLGALANGGVSIAANVATMGGVGVAQESGANWAETAKDAGFDTPEKMAKALIDDEDSKAVPFSFGIAQGALDSIVPGRIGGKLLKSLGKKRVKQLSSWIIDSGIEGSTEAMQEFLGDLQRVVANGGELEKGFDEYAESFWQGVIGAGGVSGAASGASAVRNKVKESKAKKATAENNVQAPEGILGAEGDRQAEAAVVEGFVEKESKRIEKTAKVDEATPDQIQKEVEQLKENPKEYAKQQLEVAESLQEELSGKEAKENKKRIEALKEVAEAPEGEVGTPAESSKEANVETKEEVTPEEEAKTVTKENVQPEVEETVPEAKEPGGTEPDVVTDGKEVPDAEGTSEQGSEVADGSQKEDVHNKRTEPKSEQKDAPKEKPSSKKEPVRKKKTEKKAEQSVTFNFSGIEERKGTVKDVSKDSDGNNIYKVEAETYGRKTTYKVREEDLINFDPAQTNKVFSDISASKKPKAGTRVQPSPISGVKPKKIKDISVDLSKGLGNKIYYTKKPSGRRSLGSYNPRNASIAIRYNNDLDTTAHELGHALDDKFGVLSNIPEDKKASIEKELGQFSSFGSKPPKGHPNPEQYRQGEGVAEFFRAFIVNPDAAIESAPEFHAWVNETVPEKTWAKVQSFSDDVRSFVGASAHDMIAANIDFNQDKVKGSLLSKLRPDVNYEGRFHLGFADKVSQKFLNPFRAYEKAFKYAADVKGMKKIKPEKDPRIMARLFLGVNEKLDNILNNGLVNSRNGRMVDEVSGEAMSLEWLAKPYDNASTKNIEAEMQEAITYMVAERTVELKGRFEKNNTLTGIGAGIFKDEKVAQKRLNEMEALKENDPDKYERLTEGARRYREFADGVLRYMVDKGRLSEEVYQQIKKDNIQYVALQRVQEASPDEPIQVFSKGSKAIATSKNVLNKIKGSSKTIKDPYSSLLDFTNKAIKESDRNEVMLAFRDVFTVTRSMYETNPEAKNLGEIARPVGPGDPNSVKIFKDGEVEHWQLQEDVYKAVNNITDASYTLPPLLTFLPKALRWTVTNFPVFAVRNAIRDFQQRLVVSVNSPESGYDVYFDKKKNKDTKELYQLFGGGQSGYYLLNDNFYSDQMKFAVEKLSKEKNTILANPKKMGEKYQEWISSSELVSRLPEFSSAFKKAKKEGLDDYNASLYAAFQARDLMDFSVAGEYMRIVNQLIPFSNAGVQGLRRTIRSAKENPAEFAFRTFLYSVIPSVLNRILVDMMDEDEEYRQLPAWRRDLFYNIPIGDDLWLSIPKSFEIGVLGSGAERLVDMIYYDNDEAMEGYAGSVGRAMMPVDEAALAGPLRTFVEELTNYDFFREKHIIPTHEENKALELRNTERASRLSRGVQSMVGLDARLIDHFIGNQFSYFGNMALKLSDIGREDDRNQFHLGDLGIFKKSPAYDSKDVQWVMHNAKEMGLFYDPLYKEMNLLIGDYFEAETDEESEKRAKVLRDYAKTLKKVWKEYGLDDPKNSSDKRLKNKAKSNVMKSTDRKALMDARRREHLR